MGYYRDKETYYRGKRDLQGSNGAGNGHAVIAKETYYRGKRDLLQRQKRPATEARETCRAATAPVTVMPSSQKSPTIEAKESCRAATAPVTVIPSSQKRPTI